MLSHELAKILLENPNLPVLFDADFCDMEVIRVQVGTGYLNFYNFEKKEKIRKVGQSRGP